MTKTSMPSLMLGHCYMKCSSWCSQVIDFWMGSLTGSLPFTLKTPDLWKINHIWLALPIHMTMTLAVFQHMYNTFLLPTKSCILCIIFAIKQAPVRHANPILTLRHSTVIYMRCTSSLLEKNSLYCEFRVHGTVGFHLCNFKKRKTLLCSQGILY